MVRGGAPRGLNAATVPARPPPACLHGPCRTAAWLAPLALPRRKASAPPPLGRPSQARRACLPPAASCWHTSHVRAHCSSPKSGSPKWCISIARRHSPVLSAYAIWRAVVAKGGGEAGGGRHIKMPGSTRGRSAAWGNPGHAPSAHAHELAPAPSGAPHHRVERGLVALQHVPRRVVLLSAGLHHMARLLGWGQQMREQGIGHGAREAPL